MAKKMVKNVKPNLDNLQNLNDSNVSLRKKTERGVIFVGTEQEIYGYSRQKRMINDKKMYMKFNRRVP